VWIEENVNVQDFYQLSPIPSPIIAIKEINTQRRAKETDLWGLLGETNGNLWLYNLSQGYPFNNQPLLQLPSLINSIQVQSIMEKDLTAFLCIAGCDDGSVYTIVFEKTDQEKETRERIEKSTCKKKSN
jgi:hypothetical protein